MRVSTDKEFAKAVERGEEEIEVVGDYAGKVCDIFRIKPVSWALIISGLGVGIGMAPLSGGLSLGAAASLMPIGALCGGLSVGVTTALGALLAVGGVALLRKIRGYEIVDGHDRRHVTLRKKT